MKIKVKPEDFVVEEVADLPPGEGHFAVYLLEKTGLTTIDALANVARAFDLPRDRVRHGGLKDRHAVTRQHLWIENGPPRSVEQPGLALRFLRRAPAPPKVRGNSFHITLRELVPEEAGRLAAAAEAVAADGVPNFFDSQRFGSARHGEGFAGKKILLHRWEEALQLHLARPSSFDTDSRRKRMLAFKRHWGQWEHCLEKSATRTEAHIFGYLARRRGDFKGALKLIERPMLALFMHTYQSWLWNEAVCKYMKATLPSDLLMPARYLGGRLLFHRFVPADLIGRWRKFEVPLMAYRTRFRDGQVEKAYLEVLRSEKLTQLQFKPPGHNVPYMKEEERRLLLFPEKMTAEAPVDDELFPGKKKAATSFELARGGYATLVVKKLRLLISGEEGGEAEEGRDEEES